MTLIRQDVETKILFYPKTAIPRRLRDGVVVSHVYSDMIKRDWADVLEKVQDLNPTISLNWQGQPAFNTIDEGLLFCRFHKDGRVTFGATALQKDGGKGDVAGWALRCRYAPLDCKIGITAPEMDAGNFDSRWKTLEGQWETTKPVRSPQATCLQNRGSHLLARAQTIGNIAARRGLSFNVSCIGIIDPSLAAPYIRVVGQLKHHAILLPHGDKPCVQIPVGADWSTIRTLHQLPTVDLSKSQDYQIEMFIMNDRLVVGINGQYAHIIEVTPPLKPNGKPQPKKAHWEEGPIQIITQNCRIVAGVSLIKWAAADDTPYTSSFAATDTKKTNLSSLDGLTAYATGAQPDGSQILAAALIDGQNINYTVTLTASAAGIDSPFVTKCVIYKAPDWGASDIEPIDVSAAMEEEGWSVTSAMPPITNGATATVALNRTMLNHLFGDDEEEGWQHFIGEKHPCEIFVRNLMRNDANGALSYDPPVVAGIPQYYRLFKGYTVTVSKDTQGFNQNTMRVTMQDPMWRLRGNNARITYKFPPLDWVFMNLADAALGDTPVNQSEANLNDFVIYGVDCIKEMIRLQLGDAEANAINGGSEEDDQTKRFYPHDEDGILRHPPLISNDVAHSGGLLFLQSALTNQPVTENEWFFPAPLGEDVETWINKIATEKDYSVAFYGWPDGSFSTDWPVLCYGRITEFLKKLHPYQTTFIEIPDNDYVSGDVNKLLKMAAVENRPEKSVTTAIALGDQPTGGLEAILPSLRIGEARLDESDINSAEKTWETIILLRNSMYMFPGQAEEAAQKFIAAIANLILQWPDLTFRGMPVQWGSICKLKANGTYSDTTLGIHGLPFRVEKVIQKGSAGQIKTWDTTVYARPLSTTELAAIPAEPTP